jgi:hypothetical protein
MHFYEGHLEPFNFKKKVAFSLSPFLDILFWSLLQGTVKDKNAAYGGNRSSD